MASVWCLLSLHGGVVSVLFELYRAAFCRFLASVCEAKLATVLNLLFGIVMSKNIRAFFV